MPNKEFEVGGTVYEFPDTFSDEKVQGILTKQGVIKPKASADMPLGKALLQPAIGIAKGLGHTALGISRLGAPLTDRFLTESQRKEDAAFRGKAEEFLKPSNALQSGGYAAEQVGEFFVPIPGLAEVRAPAAVGRLGKALVTAGREAADVGLKTAAQTGSLKEGAKVGAIAGPVGAVAEASIPIVSKLLKRAAEAQYGKVLHPLGRKAKEVAEEHLPEIVGRGYKQAAAATKTGLSEKFTNRATQLGQQIEAEYGRLDPVTRTKLKPIYDDLSKWIEDNAFTKAGTIKDQAILDAGMDKMKYIQDALGPYLGDAAPSTVWEVRQALDRYVYKNGLTADESVAAGNYVREATANAIRRALNEQHPTVAALNKEFHLWRSAAELMQRNVQSDIGKLHFARNAGLIGRSLVGAAIGEETARHGGAGVWETVGAAALGGLAMQSTAWRTVSAVSKAKIADLLAAGQGEAAANMAARLTGVSLK